MTKNKKIAGTCTLDEAFERFASESEENRKVLEESKRLIKGEGYVRLKHGIYQLAEMREREAVIWNKDWELTAINKRKIVKQADTIEELIQAGDLVMARDYWERTNKKTHMTLIDPTLLPVQEGTVTKLYIEQYNGDYKLFANSIEEGELRLL